MKERDSGRPIQTCVVLPRTLQGAKLLPRHLQFALRMDDVVAITTSPLEALPQPDALTARGGIPARHPSASESLEDNLPPNGDGNQNGVLNRWDTVLSRAVGHPDKSIRRAVRESQAALGVRAVLKAIRPTAVLSRGTEAISNPDRMRGQRVEVIVAEPDLCFTVFSVPQGLIQSVLKSLAAIHELSCVPGLQAVFCHVFL
mmetsp:Transcript_15866/g.24686  ORF Transcript_15866/g.24686 Transcript_15866/m.24686 type:complete len:201 (-) Transcript_15866:1446-2048(-)